MSAVSFGRLVLYGFVGLIVIAICYAVIQWYAIERAISKSKVLFASTTPYEQHPSAAAARILVAGDSTGVGTGAKDSVNSIAGRLGRVYPSAAIENRSRNGMRIAELDATLQALPERRYNLMVLQIGANDITMLTALTKVRESLVRVLTYATDHADHVVLITAGNVGLSPVFYWPLSAVITQRTRAVRAIFLDETARYNTVSYIDLFREAKDEPFNTDIPKYYAADRFHPSDEGYGLWFDQMKPVLPESL